MKQWLRIFFLAALIFPFLSCGSTLEPTILSNDFYHADVALRDIDSMTFRIPLVTNFEVSSIETMTLRSSIPVDFRFTLLFIETYRNHFSEAIILEIDTSSFSLEQDESLIVDQAIFTTSGIEFVYEFGEIKITNHGIEAVPTWLTITGQGIYYANFSVLNLDLRANASTEIVDLTLTGGMEILNRNQYLETYASGSQVALSVQINPDDIEVLVCYELDLLVSVRQADGILVFVGLSTFQSQIDVINRALIDSLEE